MKMYVKTTGSGFLPEEEKGFELMRFARVSEFDNKHLEALEEMGYTIVYSSSAGNAGLRLRKYREAAGKSAAEMAEELGVSELRYKRMESGVSLITPKALALIPAGAPAPAANAEKVAAARGAEFQKWLDSWVEKGMTWDDTKRSRDVLRRYQTGALEFTQEIRGIFDGILKRGLSEKEIVPEVITPAPSAPDVSGRKNLTSSDVGFADEAQRAADYWQAFMKPYRDAGLKDSDTGESDITIGVYNRGWRTDRPGSKVVFWLTPGEEKRFREKLDKALLAKADLPPKKSEKFEKWWNKWELEGMVLEDIDEDSDVVWQYRNGELEFTKDIEDRLDDQLTDELVRRLG